MSISNVFIALPAYNEEEVITNVLSQIQKEGYSNIVVVDDGSTDNTATKAEQAGATVIRHSINRGPGAATQTAFDACIKLGAEIILTMDADGQHHASDISKILKHLETTKADIVIGSRFLETNKIPFHRRVFNAIGNMVTFLFFGLWVSDSQSGFKVFTKKAVEKIDIHSNGYEFCSELIWEFRIQKFHVEEFPISVTYTKRSLSKGQSFFVGTKTFFRLFLRSIMRVRY